VIGGWRGVTGASASMTLVWGRTLVAGRQRRDAELGELTVDECGLSGDRFTLLAPDDFDGKLLEIRLYDAAAASSRASRCTRTTQRRDILRAAPS